MRRGTLFWGIILILLGVVFMLDQMGVFARLGFSVWGLFGPLMLILVGAWLIFGRYLRPKPIIGHAAIPLENANRARIKVRHGAGKLTIGGNAEPGALISGEFGGGVDYLMDVEDGVEIVKLRVPEQNIPWAAGPGFSLDWSFSIARDIPLTLDINTGASQSSIDLNDLKVTELSLGTGASATDLTLPANAGFTRVVTESGAASLNIRIPSGVAARIRSSSGLASVTVDTARFPRAGGGYESPDYGAAANKVELDIKTGVGAVDIR